MLLKQARDYRDYFAQTERRWLRPEKILSESPAFASARTEILSRSIPQLPLMGTVDMRRVVNFCACYRDTEKPIEILLERLSQLAAGQITLSKETAAPMGIAEDYEFRAPSEALSKGENQAWNRLRAFYSSIRCPPRLSWRRICAAMKRATPSPSYLWSQTV